MKETAPRAYSTSHAAAMLDLSQEALRYRVRSGQIRAARIGRQLFIPATELDRLLTPEEHGQRQEVGAAR